MDGYRGFLGLLVSALLVGFLSVLFTLIWVLHYREGLGWDGSALEFNWHPVLVVTGLVFIQGIGTGHCLGGSGDGSAGLGVPDRVPTGRGRRAAGEPGAGRAPGAESAGEAGWPRPGRVGLGPRGAGSGARRWGPARRAGFAGGSARGPRSVNSLLRVAGTRWWRQATPDSGAEQRCQSPWGPAAHWCRAIAPCGSSLRKQGRGDAPRARPSAELASRLQFRRGRLRERTVRRRSAASGLSPE